MARLSWPGWLGEKRRLYTVNGHPVQYNSVTICRENREMLGNFKDVREMSGILVKSSKCRNCQGNKACQEKLPKIFPKNCIASIDFFVSLV